MSDQPTTVPSWTVRDGKLVLLNPEVRLCPVCFSSLVHTAEGEYCQACREMFHVEPRENAR